MPFFLFSRFKGRPRVSHISCFQSGIQKGHLKMASSLPGIGFPAVPAQQQRFFPR
ncbi:hypothetical protein ABH899_002719 [Paenibacillus sp. RC84]